MDRIGTLLSQHELLLLFGVILLGLLLGRLQLGSTRLGAAGVLFAGLGVSAWLRPAEGHLQLATELRELGLVLFVYCIGLTSGPGFFSASRREGLRLNLATLIALGCGALASWSGGWLLGLDRGLIAGVFCGALTNTPALGAASDRLSGTALESHTALGYSITYPLGVLGALLLSRACAARQRAELERELAARAAARASIESANLEVNVPTTIGRSVGELRVKDVTGVLISRVRHGGKTLVPTKYTRLQRGDVITVVGTPDAITRAVTAIGPRSSEHLEAHREHVDMRRVLVSKHSLVGKTLEEIGLERRFNAQATRLRRADIDLMAASDLRLELGDRLRVVAPVSKLKEVAEFFGDSERELAEVDYVALALGLCLGLALARAPLPFLGEGLHLGTAGGPLLAALVLGRVGRTGPLVWAMPFDANLALREFGLLLFLAGVGVASGGRLDGVFNLQGLSLLLLGLGVTTITSGVALLLLLKWAKTGLIGALGSVSGLQTQPATLAAASELTRHADQTIISYALVYPVAMIGKILLAQLLAVP